MLAVERRSVSASRARLVFKHGYTSPTMPGQRRKSTIRRFVLGMLLSGIVVVGIGVYWVWHMSWQAPTWYRPPQPTDATASQWADDTEYRLLQQTRKVREPHETWRLTLTEAEMNAWLATRLPAWIAHDAQVQWPEQIGTPQVLIERDGVSIAVPVTAKGVTRTVVAKLRPQMGEVDANRSVAEQAQDSNTGSPAAPAASQPASRDNGLLSLPLISVSLGKVWIPGEPLQRVVDSVREAAPEFLDDPRVKQAIAVLAGRDALDPVHRLGDGRLVRITAVELRSGSIVLTARTLSGESTHASP
jgi:hypothetical protein